MTEYSNRPERPRLEPEIIPPAHGRRESGWQYEVWPRYMSSTGGTHRLYVARLGPLGRSLPRDVFGPLVAGRVEQARHRGPAPMTGRWSGEAGRKPV